MGLFDRKPKKDDSKAARQQNEEERIKTELEALAAILDKTDAAAPEKTAAPEKPTPLTVKFMYTICHSEPNLSGSWNSAASLWTKFAARIPRSANCSRISLRQPKITKSSAPSITNVEPP